MNGLDNYFFISYSQNDIEVEQDSIYFDKNYINYWIDREGMRATDESWIKKVEEIVSDDACRGAVFYLSINSLKSGAVEKEIDVVANKKKNNPDFFIFAILLDGISIPHLIKKVYDSIADRELSRILPLSRIIKIGTLFSDEKIYIIRDPEQLDKYREKMLITLKGCDVVRDKACIEDMLMNQNKLDSYKRYNFGMFYTSITVSSNRILPFNKFVKINNEWLIKLSDGTVRIAEPIKWMILSRSPETMTLISEGVIERIQGDSIDEWLNDEFLTLAFNEEEKEMLVGFIRTLTYKEYNDYSCKFDINPTESSFWLSSINSRNQTNMLMYVNGKTVNTIGCHKKYEKGIRPVIELKIDKMLEEKKDG